MSYLIKHMKKVFINSMHIWHNQRTFFGDGLILLPSPSHSLMLFESHAKGKGIDGSAVPANQYADINHDK